MSGGGLFDNGLAEVCAPVGDEVREFFGRDLALRVVVVNFDKDVV